LLRSKAERGPSVNSSIPPAMRRKSWRPGDELNEKQAFLITQNAPLRMVALAADAPPTPDVASSFDFPQARLARPRPRLRLIRGGRR
jgi:hypothetical protein